MQTNVYDGQILLALDRIYHAMYKQLDVKFISIVSYCLFIIHVAELFLYRKSVNSAICVYKIDTCCKTLSSKIKKKNKPVIISLISSPEPLGSQGELIVYHQMYRLWVHVRTTSATRF